MRITTKVTTTFRVTGVPEEVAGWDGKEAVKLALAARDVKCKVDFPDHGEGFEITVKGKVANGTKDKIEEAINEAVPAAQAKIDARARQKGIFVRTFKFRDVHLVRTRTEGEKVVKGVVATAETEARKMRADFLAGKAPKDWPDMAYCYLKDLQSHYEVWATLIKSGDKAAMRKVENLDTAVRDVYDAFYTHMGE
jgi:hypothetical protein